MISGINLTAGQTTSAPGVKFVSGDINSDNELNLLDYNIFISCFGGKACDKKQQADLNLDGKIDEVDLNILYTQFATRKGE